MRLSISHETIYRYDAPVRHSTQYLRLTPHSSLRQRVLDWELELPVPAFKSVDPYGNILHVLTLDFPHQEISIKAHGVVETDDLGPEPEDKLPPLFFLRHTELTAPDEPLKAFADGYRDEAHIEFALTRLMLAIREHMPFTPGETTVQTSAAEAFARGQGVCQDHTHVFLSCSRHLGVPARYVSGYIYSPGHVARHVASHAWAEAWINGRWHSFDIANGTPANDNHLKLAIGMDYLDACPIRGVRNGGGAEEMDASAWVWLDDQ
ncbi:transglutaminase family protein [Chitinivorax sp. PXF-14]|uniref:transglutaminase family protein n=1 Tax=Chitinivorax sp. PXF-14 TaxID=3230488 RepID=UPI0034656690